MKLYLNAAFFIHEAEFVNPHVLFKVSSGLQSPAVLPQVSMRL